MKANIVNTIKPDFQQVVYDSRHNLFDLIRGIIAQIGSCDLRIATFSNSEEFLRRLYLQKKKGQIRHLTLITDTKAAKKTLKLANFILNVYDEVFFANNHSKVVLFDNENHHIAILTSQNQTRGSRYECHVISNNTLFFTDLEQGFEQIKNKAHLANELLRRHNKTNSGVCVGIYTD